MNFAVTIRGNYSNRNYCKSDEITNLIKIRSLMRSDKFDVASQNLSHTSVGSKVLGFKNIILLTSCFQIISPAIFVRCTVRSQENGVKHSACLRTVPILYWQTVKAWRTFDGTVCDVTFVTRLNDVDVEPEVIQLHISFHVFSTFCWFEQDDDKKIQDFVHSYWFNCKSSEK